MHKQNDVVIYVEAGVETNALVISSSSRADILAGTAVDPKNPPPVVEHLNIVLVPEKTVGITNLTSIAHGFFLRTVFGVRPLKDGSSAGFKEFVETSPSTVRAMRDTIDQVDIQLTGCSVAALGYPYARIAKPGDYGYSAAYQDVLDLRAKYEALLAETQKVPGDPAAENSALPSAADLDAVTAEQKVAEATSGSPLSTPDAAAPPECQCATPVPVAALSGTACGTCGGDIIPAQPVIETKTYTDGSSATGVAPLPDQSPEQQDAAEAEAHPV